MLNEFWLFIFKSAFYKRKWYTIIYNTFCRNVLQEGDWGLGTGIHLFLPFLLHTRLVCTTTTNIKFAGHMSVSVCVRVCILFI